MAISQSVDVFGMPSEPSRPSCAPLEPVLELEPTPRWNSILELESDLELVVVLELVTCHNMTHHDMGRHYNERY